MRSRLHSFRTARPRPGRPLVTLIAALLPFAGCEGMEGDDPAAEVAETVQALLPPPPPPPTKVPAVGSPTGFVRSGAGPVSSIMYRSSPTGDVKELSRTGTTWTLSNISAITGSPPAYDDYRVAVSAYIRNDGVNSVVYRDVDSHIRELTQVGTAWSGYDLTRVTGAPVASGSPAVYLRGDGVSVVLYRDSSNHIRELSLGRGSTTWLQADLTAILGAPAALTDPLGYVRGDGVSAVVFQSLNGHVWELSLAGSTWSKGDLTALTSAPLATSFAPRPYRRSDGVSSVVYLDGGYNVQELSLSGGRWWVNNLTAISGGPHGISCIPYVRNDGVNVILVMADGHLHELQLAGSTWRSFDLSAITGARTPHWFRIPSGYVRGDNVNTVIYESDVHRMVELSLVGSSWVPRDLSTVVGGT
jgi:hypothetical protein